MKLSHMTAAELKQLLADKKTSSHEIMMSVLDEIDRREPDVQAFINIRDRNDLLNEAKEIDQRRLKGENIGILDGLPIAVKDNICTQNIPTTCASRMLENFVPPYNATVIERIRNADGIIIGKTNMDEFAMGSSTENSAMKVTHNPHNLEHVPGGTSGGSTAAVAANECILAIGSDTGGSIRQPASFCGVVGMKPTYGLVSRYGLVAYASSLDQIGPVAKTVNDAAMLLNVIAGHDPKDSTSLNHEIPNYSDACVAGKRLRIGVPSEYYGSGLDEEVRRSVENAIGLLKQDGHEIVPISLPHTKYAVPAYYITACAEASSNLSRYDGVKYGFRAKDYEDLIDMYSNTRSQGFGAEVKRRIILGAYTLSAGYYDAYYLKAAKVRTLLSRDFVTAFEICDVIVHPVAPTAAFKIGEKTDDPLEMYLQDIYSVVANLVGLPAISIPCGWTANGLPLGIQLVTKQLDEPTLFTTAGRLETLLQANQAWKR